MRNKEIDQNQQHINGNYPEVVHHPPNHLAGGLRSALRKGETGRVGSGSSTRRSTAVVRGLLVVAEEEKASGLGYAARRVLAGGGTVTVEGGRVSVTVWVSTSYAVSATYLGTGTSGCWYCPG